MIHFILLIGSTNNKKYKKILNKIINIVFLFETPHDFQPIMCFNIITRSKCYSLFPILSGLIYGVDIFVGPGN